MPWRNANATNATRARRAISPTRGWAMGCYPAWPVSRRPTCLGSTTWMTSRITRRAKSPRSGAGALAAARVQIDRAVGDGEAEGRPDGALDQADLAAMGAHQLGGDGEAEAGAAGAGRALKRLEQVGPRLLRQARSGVRHLDHHHCALAAAGDADLVAAGVLVVAAVEPLPRIAREVEQDAEQLLGVGVDHQPALDRADPAHRRGAVEPERLAHIVHQRLERDAAAVGRRLLHAAIRQGRLAEGNRALERTHQLRREALHVR